MKRAINPNNWEENENIRQIFIDSTRKNLWENPTEDNYYFSDEYVYWLEERLLESNFGE